MPQDDLAIQRQWYINGEHYSRTLEAWLQRMDAQRKQIMPIFKVSAPTWNSNRIHILQLDNSSVECGIISIQ